MSSSPDVAADGVRDLRADARADASADLALDMPSERFDTMPDTRADLPPDGKLDTPADGRPDTPADMTSEVSRDVPGDGADAGLGSRDAEAGDRADVLGTADAQGPGLWILAGLLAGPGALDGIGPAAQFYFPAGAATDGAGNLYIADAANDTIRKIVLATAEVTTLAGSLGVTGSDDGIGTSARFFSPQGLACDGAGNLYIADSVNSTIRRLALATGEVTTIAGTANALGSQDGRGQAARFDSPMSLAYDGAGHLFVADIDGTIRDIVLTTGDVTTVAGSSATTGSQDGTGTSALFWRPQGVVSDGAGTLYVADTDNHTIRKIVVETGSVTTFVGTAGADGIDDGVGSAARFSYPHGLSTDGHGNLFVADFGSNRIRKVVLATAEVTTLAGVLGYNGYSDGPGDVAEFNGPDYLACDAAGNLFVTDSANQTVRRIAVATSGVTTFAGLGSSAGSDDGVGAGARFNWPMGLVSDGAGNLFVADALNRTIRKVVAATGAVSTLAGLANQSGSRDGTGADARFGYPAALAFDGAGTLFVADQTNNLIRKVDLATAVVTTVAGEAGIAGSDDGVGTNAHFDSPASLALDGAGNLFVGDTAMHTLRKIALASGTVTTFAGVAGSLGGDDGVGTAARFDDPAGLACDGVGNLFVADSGTYTLRKIVLATATVTTLAGTTGVLGSDDGIGAAARFQMLGALVADGAGNLFVADMQNDMVRKVNVTTGLVTTVIGHAGRWETIPGPLPAYIASPTGLAVLPSGDLAITDIDANAVLIARF